MPYVKVRPNVPIDVKYPGGIWSIYDYADMLGGIDNGGRTWLRLMTPVTVRNYGEIYGHGTAQARSYPATCVGLIRGLTGRNAGFPYGHPQVYWQQYGPWYDDGMGNFYSDSETGDLIGAWRGWQDIPQGGHYFDQDELTELLTGATLNTPSGSFAFTTDWLDGGEYESPVGAAVLASNVVGEGNYLNTSITLA